MKKEQSSWSPLENWRNFNRWHVITASASLVAAVAVAAATLPKGSAESEPEHRPPGATASCYGQVDGVAYEGWGKDGDSITITDINGGDCAPVYDPNPLSMQQLTTVHLGEKVIACTFIEDGKTPHLTVMKNISDTHYAVGAVNLSPAGVAQVPAAGVHPCSAQGIQDQGFIGLR